MDSEELLHNIWLAGEISTFNIVKNNAYFVLKDEGAQIECVCFGADAVFKNPIKYGDKIKLLGSLNYYIKGGKINFAVKAIEQGLFKGDLYKNFLQLKERLSAEGLFAQAHKISLPKYAKKIGVVTSETGAVIRDIINVAHRRNGGCDIVLYPARVQGEGAAGEIAAGVEYLDKYCDAEIIIVARGGGSAEDLAAFNDEGLVRAVYACVKPVVSAVGHETDFSLVDFVSDLRAPTPSAAAELCVYDLQSERQRLSDLIYDIKKGVTKKFVYARAAAEKNINALTYTSKNIIDRNYNGLNKKMTALSNAVDKNFAALALRLNLSKNAIEKSNPMQILSLGYAKLSLDGKIISSVENVKIDDKLNLKLSDGSIDAVVTEIKT
jgi:exodeoxyribonuclease VII large subunit